MSEPSLKRQKTDTSEPIIDSTWLKSLATQLKQSIQQNSNLRSKYPNEPLKFIDSETSLNVQLKELTNLTQSSEPLFDELIQLLNEELIVLLNHPNFDIVQITLKFFYDLIDVEYKDDQEEFINWLKDSDFLKSVVHLLQKFNDEKDDEVLEIQIIDSLLDYDDADLAAGIVKNKAFMKEFEEFLKTLDGENDEVYMDLLYKLITIDVDIFLTQYGEIVEILLHQLNRIKKLEDDQLEYIDSVVLNLKVLLSEPKGIELFLKNEGFELLSLLINDDSIDNLNIFINLLNLVLESSNDAKNVDISTRVIKTNKFLKQLFKYLVELDEVDEINQYLKFLNKLLELLPFESDERLRLINKLTDKSFKNLKALNKIEAKYSKRVDHDFEYNDEDYSERLWEGLNIIQQISILKCWLLTEDESVSKQLKGKLIDSATIKTVFKGLQDELQMNLQLLNEGSIRTAEEGSSALLIELTTQLETLKELSKALE